MMRLQRSLFRDRQLRKRHQRRTTPSQYHRRPTFENLEPRTLLAATLINTPSWVDRGPGPITSAQSELNGNGISDSKDLAVGDVAAIAVDPTNANHVFIGTANGGVWETQNANTTTPFWTTTTDQLPSLGISAIAINPANVNHIYAGTGAISAAGEGGLGVGLYRSFDGGTTWSQLGFDTFKFQRIRRIIPTTLDTIFVDTDSATGGGGLTGIFRSDDRGKTWRRLSGASGTGLPDRSTTDLVSFPVNSTTVGFYAAVPDVGIFRSTDNGNTWQSITNNLAAAFPDTIRIVLSVSPAAGKPVYAGIVDPHDLDPDHGFRVNVFRSIEGTDGKDNNHNGLIDEPAEATWGSVAPTPPIFTDVLHVAILADSTRSNIVYAGGTIGDGLLFRGDATARTWTTLTLPSASNTSPHVDVQNMVFSGSDILRGDDGGIYRLVNPLGLSTLPATVWQSEIGNLHDSEIDFVALDNRGDEDPLNDVILAGMQDNGSAVRDLTGVWTQAAGGDGTITQALHGGFLPIEYVTSLGLGVFKKRSGFNSGFDDLQRTVNGTNSEKKLDRTFDDGLGSIVPYQVHATDANRLLLGSLENLYESTDKGDSFTSLGGVGFFFDISNPAAPKKVWFPKSLSELSGAGSVTSIAYGSKANAGIAYIGTASGDIFFRTTTGGTFQKTNFSTAVVASEGSANFPLDIVLDTNNPQRAYAVTSSGVYMTQNMSDWQPLTEGGLSSLAAPGRNLELHAIALVTNDTDSIDDDVVLVSGFGGVFRRLVTANPKSTPWSEYGQGLPNTLVTDIEYDSRSDTLVAGTLGRGAWTISQVKSTIGLESQLQIIGTIAADTIRIVRSVNNPTLLDVFFNNTSSTPSLTVQLSVLQSIQVSGGEGADSFEIQSTGGVVSVPRGIEFDGGFDKGATIPTVDRLVLNNLTDARGATGEILSGGIIHSSLVGRLTFSGVEAITILFGSGNDTFDGSGASVPLALVGGPGADTLTGGSANDTFDSRDGFSFNDHLFGGPGKDTAQMDPFDFFDGGPDQDGIDFFGTAGNDRIRVSRQVGPDGPQALIEMNNKVQVFNYLNGETINVYAGAGNDHVEMDASAGSHWKAQFFGQEGNDRLIGGAMDDLLDGGPGNDFLDGAGGDNTLIGGGGHDVLRNGHAPLAARTIAAASTAISSGSTTKSSSARLVQAPVQVDNRSRSLDPSSIDSYYTLAAGFLQNSATKDLSSSGTVLLEHNSRGHIFDEALFNSLASGSLSKEDGSVTGTIDRAFATYFSMT